MQRKYFRIAVYALVASIASTIAMEAQKNVDLPTTEILGKRYYIYTTQKGESLYGIAYKFGWNIEELARINPESTHNLRKGRILYYPIAEINDTVELADAVNPQPFYVDPDNIDLTAVDFEPIIHKVKKGESLYGIARQYGLSLDEIYEANPSSKYGIKTGEDLVIPQSDATAFYFYTLKEDDTLSALSRKYNTSIEDILKANPGLSENNFREGETIRINPNTAEPSKKLVTEHLSEEKLTGISGYKVEKNDTWSSISEKVGVDEQTLRDVNPDAIAELKKNQVIHVPKVETFEFDRSYLVEDDTEISSERIHEIYDSIHGALPSQLLLEKVKVALILDDPASKKDMDFTRGFLMALHHNNKPDFKIDLKVIDGRVATSALSDSISDYEPTLIISTADKAFPAFLADYGNTNNVTVINAFDLQNDLFEDNASIIQMLLPSTFFSEHIAEYLYNKNNDRKLVVVGVVDKSDAIGNQLMEYFGGENTIKMTPDDFITYVPDKNSRLLIYPTVTSKEDITTFITNLETVKKESPFAEIVVVGRPHWAAYSTDLQDKFKSHYVYVPARSWLDESTDKWKNFTEQYTTLFEGTPLKTIPNYAASGYDIASYFLPVIARNGNDFNLDIEIADPELLQADMNLKRVNNWGGLMNMTGYILKFSPVYGLERIVIQ